MVSIIPFSRRTEEGNRCGLQHLRFETRLCLKSGRFPSMFPLSLSLWGLSRGWTTVTIMIAFSSEYPAGWLLQRKLRLLHLLQE